MWLYVEWPAVSVSRLTENRGQESPGRSASARQRSSFSQERRTSTSPQPYASSSPTAAAPSAAAGPSSTSAAAAAAVSDEASPVSRASSATVKSATGAHLQRMPSLSVTDAQPQRAGSYHGPFHRAKNRLADSPLRAISVDAARVRC